jgi:hypothetical protein
MSNVTLKSKLLAQWKTIAAVLVLIGVGSFFFYGGVANVLDEYRLRDRGETTPGFIIDTWEDVEEADSGEDIWHYGATYTYQLPDGQEFSGELNGEGRLKPEFRYLSQPYPIEVTYLPDNPAVSRITEDLPDSILGLLRDQIFPYGVCSALFLFLGFYLLRRLIGELKHAPEANDLVPPTGRH